MDIRPIDVNELVGVVMGCAIPLVAVTGIMVRIALKPLLEAMARARGVELVHLEQRVAMLERRLELGPPGPVVNTQNALEPVAVDPALRLRD
jgi:hypothetical protein